MSKPNIIFIISDQMRGDCLGVEGHPVIQTPNLDYLASCGTRFRHAYTAVPSCIPARASIWTGMNQWHTGILGMGWGQGQMPDNYPHLLAEELTRAGYRTHRIGKGHFHPHTASMGFETFELDESGRTLVQGFKDDYRIWFDLHAPKGTTPDDHGIDWNGWNARPWPLDEHLHPTFWTISRAIDFLKSCDHSRPFFLNISFAKPHSPYVPPEYYFNLYRHRTPEPYVGSWASVHDIPTEALDISAWHGRMTSEQIDIARAAYYGEISFIDNQIGRLLIYMRRFHRQILHNTWIVFTSDHGDMIGDHHLWRKTYAYEGSARVPLIIVPPSNWGHDPVELPDELWQILPSLTPPVRMGKKVRDVADEPVSLQDIMPTLLEAAGVIIPPTVDGRSLLPVLKQPTTTWRKYIHGEHSLCYAPEQEMQYLTDGKRKFIWFPRTNQIQFFDLEQDSGELHDLSNAPEREKEMEQWRSYLIQELTKRRCGWIKDGDLYCPPGKALISPYKQFHWLGE
jgi:arylsulfatase A-like enzyme